MQGVYFAGFGAAVPKWFLPNFDLAQHMGNERERLRTMGIDVPEEQEKEFLTTDEWIRERTGVRQRYFCPLDNTVATSDLAVEAAGNAWTDAYGEGLDVYPEFIILATVSPDHFTTPPTAVIVHRKLGIPKTVGGRLWPCVVADVTLACTSFMVALQYGCMLIETGRCQRGLVIGADRMSSVMSFHRRSPLVVLGDGAGAIVLQATSAVETQSRSHDWLFAADGGAGGKMEDLIKNWAGGSAKPLRLEHLHPLVDAHLMVMDGNPVFKTVSPLVAKTIIPSILQRSSLTLRDIDVLALHQANQRITDNVASSLQQANPDVEVRIVTLDNLEGTPVKGGKSGNRIVNIFCNIERYGNMTSASVPTVLCEAREAGLLPKGSKALVAAFGGGLSWGATIVRF